MIRLYTEDRDLAPGSAAHHQHALDKDSHTVQFYEDPQYLFEVVAQYLYVGFKAGEPVVVIATAAHLAGFEARLKAKGVDVERACHDGRFVRLDARDTLARLMVAGLPDWSRVQRVLGSVLEESHRSAGGVRVRAYGEMVDLLLQDRNPQGALLLEEQWNELGKAHPFSLLCAYAMGNFHTREDAQVFHEVCSSHSHVTPAEQYSQAGSEDARLREVSALQQRAKALETEIEHRKRIETELVKALRLRDDFLSIAGHELRTPLTALQLQIHSLSSMTQQSSDERLKAKVERAGRQTERLVKLTEGLLDVARISAGKLTLQVEECDLAALVRDVVDRSAEAVAQAECPLRMLVEEPVKGRWDRLRVEQVVTNLFSNALKYGAGKPVEVSVKTAKDRARLVVRDHGIGVPLEDQSRIFDRFERAASLRNYGGLGLGLWIARQIVDAHGGSIRVESEPCHGATFTVELPYAGS